VKERTLNLNYIIYTGEPQ